MSECEDAKRTVPTRGKFPLIIASVLILLMGMGLIGADKGPLTLGAVLLVAIPKFTGSSTRTLARSRRRHRRTRRSALGTQAVPQYGPV
jgi:hypothetical protein